MGELNLKACPFCGKEPSHAERLTDTLYAVICYCEAQGPTIEQLMEGRDFDGKGCRKAIKAWNTRSDLSRLLTPSDSDTAKALEALAQIEEDAHNADLTESIRTCILSLSAQLAEKEREVKETL